MEDKEPELARVLSLGVMAHLAASSRNCHSLLHNEKARISYKHEVLQGSHLLLAPCGKWELLVAECFVLVLLQVRLSLASLQSAYQPQEVREKGLLTLVALTLPAFNECQDVSEDLRDILGKAARRTADTSQRLLVFRALWSAAAVCQSPELFFGNALIWATILQGLKQEEDADIRESALGVLGALAGQQAVAHFLWREEDEEERKSDVCEDIFLNTLREQPPRVRGRALTVVAGKRFYLYLLPIHKHN